MLKTYLVLIIAMLNFNIANCQNGKTPDIKSKADSFTNQNTSDSEQVDKIFTKVENEAEFPGSTSAWMRYLVENLDANLPVKKGAPAGTYRVIVKFIVFKNGSISNIEAVTKHGYGMEKEVIRVIKKGPKWIPAKQNENPVNAYRFQPVTFVVSNQ